jgi:hypothetical protein
MRAQTRESAAVVILAAKAIKQAIFRRNRALNWSAKTYACDKNADFTFDIPTALFSRAAERHKTVAEIGATTGRRILSIKRSLPAVAAYALDIGASYDEPAEHDGVTFLKLCDTNLTKMPTGTLFCSVGTFYLFPPDDVRRFFEFVATNKHSLFFFEPVALTRSASSFPCHTASGGFFHPYGDLAEEHGLVDAIQSRWKAIGRVKDFDQWGYSYLRPR